MTEREALERVRKWQRNAALVAELERVQAELEEAQSEMYDARSTCLGHWCTGMERAIAIVDAAIARAKEGEHAKG